MACDKVVVKDGVWQSCVWQRWCAKLVRDKVVCQSCVWQLVCVKGKVSVWQSCVSKLRLTVGVCQRWWSKMVCDKVVCDKDGVRQSVCERWCWQSVCESLCVSMVCDKVCVTKCVWQSVCERWCVTKMVCVRKREAGGGGRAEHPGYRIKNKNPTQSCGEKTHLKQVKHTQTTPETSNKHLEHLWIKSKKHAIKDKSKQTNTFKKKKQQKQHHARKTPTFKQTQNMQQSWKNRLKKTTHFCFRFLSFKQPFEPVRCNLFCQSCPD